MCATGPPKEVSPSLVNAPRTSSAEPCVATDSDFRADGFVFLRAFTPRPRGSSAAVPQPVADPLYRLVHLRVGACIAEADELVATTGVEVDPRRRRDMRFLE